MENHIDTLLRRLVAGEISLADCSAELQAVGRAYIEAEGIAKLDLDRRKRTGIPEAIYCPGKSAEEIVAIARRFAEKGFVNIIGSRADPETAGRVLKEFPDAEWHPRSRTILFRPAEIPLAGGVGIVTAGTSDQAVAEEVWIVCTALGSRSVIVSDVGVASIQRLYANLEQLRAQNVLVVIAGMEGALPSVVAGLVDLPVIAVPSGAGYGVNEGGFNALLSILGSCVPGVTAVNIDNGFGAACAAHQINRLATRKIQNR